MQPYPQFGGLWLSRYGDLDRFRTRFDGEFEGDLGGAIGGVKPQVIGADTSAYIELMHQRVMLLFLGERRFCFGERRYYLGERRYYFEVFALLSSFARALLSVA